MRDLQSLPASCSPAYPRRRWLRRRGAWESGSRTRGGLGDAPGAATNGLELGAAESAGGAQRRISARAETVPAIFRATDLERNLRRDDRTRTSLAPAGRSSFSTRARPGRGAAARAIAVTPGQRNPAALCPRVANQGPPAAVEHAHRRAAARRSALVTLGLPSPPPAASQRPLFSFPSARPPGARLTGACAARALACAQHCTPTASPLPHAVGRLSARASGDGCPLAREVARRHPCRCRRAATGRLLGARARVWQQCPGWHL